MRREHEGGIWGSGHVLLFVLGAVTWMCLVWKNSTGSTLRIWALLYICYNSLKCSKIVMWQGNKAWIRKQAQIHRILVAKIKPLILKRGRLSALEIQWIIGDHINGSIVMSDIVPTSDSSPRLSHWVGIKELRLWPEIEWYFLLCIFISFCWICLWVRVGGIV